MGINILEIIFLSVLISNIEQEKLDNYKFEFHIFLITLWIVIKFIFFVRRVNRVERYMIKDKYKMY